MIVVQIGDERLVKSRVWWVLHNLQQLISHHQIIIASLIFDISIVNILIMFSSI